MVDQVSVVMSKCTGYLVPPVQAHQWRRCSTALRKDSILSEFSWGHGAVQTSLMAGFDKIIADMGDFYRCGSLQRDMSDI